MDIFFVILLLGLIGAVGFLIYKSGITPDVENNQDELKGLLSENASVKAELQQKHKEVGELREQHNQLHKQVGELKTKDEQIVKLEAEKGQYLERLQGAGRKISAFEAKEEERVNEQERALQRTASLQKSFEDQKTQLQKDQEVHVQEEKERMDRLWNDHEQESIAHMKSVCRKNELGFNCFDNTNLPESFDGKFKPDFLVEILGQYMVIDAKMNKPDTKSSLKDYLKNATKTTAKKIKEAHNTDLIYKMVFFIVPSEGLLTLDQTAFSEDGIGFYAISKEGFEPIMAAFKRVEELEKLEAIDPQERENIVRLIADMDYELNYQNAVNVLLMARGIKVSQSKDQLNPEMQNQVEQHKQKIRVENFKPTDLKRLVANPEEQAQSVTNLLSPKVSAIKMNEVEEIQQSFL